MSILTSNELKFRKELVENKKDVDISIRDCFGKRYVLFPGQSKEILMLEKKRGKRRE